MAQHETHLDDIDSRPSYVPRASWKDIDAAICRIGAKKGALELEEGRWLLAARRAAVHTRLGFATFGEYVERRLGLDGRATAERLRVAEALTDLPGLRAALVCGARPWTAVREMVRVCVPQTEEDWLWATEGKTVREIERMVSGRAPGDRPSDPGDPSLKKHVVRLALSPELFARFREATDQVRKEVADTLSDEEALGVLFDGALGGPVDEGRSAYQLSVTLCDGCGRTWVSARGEQVEVEPEVGERALCDGNRIGTTPHVGQWLRKPMARSEATPSVEGWRPASPAPGPHARQSVTPKMRRSVFARDGGRCVVAGCKNSRYLEVHHLHPRSEGGRHALDNLVLLCGAHHRLHHQAGFAFRAAPATDRRSEVSA